MRYAIGEGGSTQGSQIPALSPDETAERITSAVAMNQTLPQEEIVNTSQTQNPSGLSPASRRGRRITRFTPLMSAVSLILLAVATTVQAQQDQSTLVPPPKPTMSSDWKRMMEGLRKAKPMPDPKKGVRPDVLTPSAGLRRFDALTGKSSNVPSGKIAAEAVGVQRENGHPGVAPTSANGVSSPKMEMDPADILRALSSAKGPTPADITPTPRLP